MAIAPGIEPKLARCLYMYWGVPEWNIVALQAPRIEVFTHTFTCIDVHIHEHAQAFTSTCNVVALKSLHKSCPSRLIKSAVRKGMHVCKNSVDNTFIGMYTTKCVYTLLMSLCFWSSVHPRVYMDLYCHVYRGCECVLMCAQALAWKNYASALDPHNINFHEEMDAELLSCVVALPGARCLADARLAVAVRVTRKTLWFSRGRSMFWSLDPPGPFLPIHGAAHSDLQ